MVSLCGRGFDSLQLHFNKIEDVPCLGVHPLFLFRSNYDFLSSPVSLADDVDALAERLQTTAFDRVD